MKYNAECSQAIIIVAKQLQYKRLGQVNATLSPMLFWVILIDLVLPLQLLLVGVSSFSTLQKYELQRGSEQLVVRGHYQVRFRERCYHKEQSCTVALFGSSLPSEKGDDGDDDDDADAADNEYNDNGNVVSGKEEDDDGNKNRQINDDNNDTLSPSSSGSGVGGDVPLPVVPKYMTAMELSYRERELELLESLRDDDSAIQKFRILWFSERGEETEGFIRNAWKLLGHPDNWPMAEETLLKLINEDPTYLHPFVLLSKLFCLQGKFQESQRICEQILKVKPYHFAVIETMIANSVAQQQDVELTNYWISKRLPPPSLKDQRWEWVHTSIMDGRRILNEAKQMNIPKCCGGTATESSDNREDGIIIIDDRKLQQGEQQSEDYCPDNTWQ